MDEYKPKRPKDTDVPIIGDYSDAANERIRADVQHRSDTRGPAEPRHEPAPDPNAPTPAQRARAANRAAGEQWALDPADVRRHAKLARQRDRIGPLGKAMRYGLVVVALAAAVAVYWNFETLRGVTIDVSALTSLFKNTPGSALGGKPTSVPEIGTVDVQAPAIAGTDAASADAPSQAPATSVAGEAARTNAPAAAAAVSAVAANEAPANEPAAAVVPAPVAAPEPPRAPEPPPEPETFGFGLPVVNVSEADASAAILILRNGDRRRASSVVWWTKDGTATAGSDYADLGKVTVKFAPGEQNRTIHIPIVSDGKVEGPESFYVYLATNEAAIAAGEASEQVEVVINDQN